MRLVKPSCAIADLGAKAVIPSIRSRKTPIPHDAARRKVAVVAIDHHHVNDTEGSVPMMSPISPQT